jgi:hypothetical protein
VGRVDFANHPGEIFRGKHLVRHVSGELQQFELFEEMTTNGWTTQTDQKSLKFLDDKAGATGPWSSCSALAFGLLWKNSVTKR